MRKEQFLIGTLFGWYKERALGLYDAVQETRSQFYDEQLPALLDSMSEFKLEVAQGIKSSDGLLLLHRNFYDNFADMYRFSVNCHTRHMGLIRKKYDKVILVRQNFLRF